MTTPALQRRTLLATTLAAIAAPRPSPAMSADLVDLAIVDRDTGQVLRVWRHRGRAYVAGRPGARYGVRLSNTTGGRILAVTSVDGVNVLSGETAGYDQAGYVLEPYQSYDIAGWRKSDTEVAAFTFAPLHRSYAALTGRPADVGVIGLAVFRERAPPPYVAPADAEAMRDQRSSLDEVVVPMARAQPQERLGTGHGAREWSAVTTVAFERATAYPAVTRQIAYDTYENLAALGIIPRPPPLERRPPRPFPASGGYVPDPPGGLAP